MFAAETTRLSDSVCFCEINYQVLFDHWNPVL